MADFLSRFQAFARQEGLFTVERRVLAAVSGGVDSVVLAKCLHATGQPFAVAHADFGLRGEASDEDARFVERLAKAYGAPFHLRRFETKTYAQKHGLSIQMAARKLRFDWFDRLLQTESYASVATAHHLTDSLETVLLNLVRGTGLAGLKGIPPKAGNKVRPLLFASKEELLAFAQAKSLDWREDASNAEEGYARNKLRHHVLPVLQELNPSLLQTFARTAERVQAAARLQAKVVGSIMDCAVFDSDGAKLIDLPLFEEMGEPQLLLFEVLNRVGFPCDYPTAKKIWRAAQGPPGKQFFAEGMALTCDRLRLVVEREDTATRQTYSIAAPEQGQFILPKVNYWKDRVLLSGIEPVGVKMEPGNRIAYLDLEKLAFPLTLRPWKQGDAFVPLGMRGRKKVSDFLIDNKVPLPEKKNVYVLESGGEICWLVGHRVSELFKIRADTKRTLVCRDARTAPLAPAG